MDASEKVIFDSRKSVFNVTLAYVVLEVVILIAGNILASFSLDIIGAIVIIVVSILNICGLVTAMYYQTRPIMLEVRKYQKLEQEAKEAP